jgi:hypothetical protein
LLTGQGASSNRTGETWELLSAGLGLRVSLLDIDRMSRADLSRYGIILFAGGSVPDSTLATLDQWIHEGGRLIAMGSAVDDVVAAELIELTERPFDLDSLTAGAAWGDRQAARGAHIVGGTILLTDLDPSHPLSFGIGASVPTFRTSSTFFEAEPSAVVVGRYGSEPLLGGYISDARLESAAGSAAVVVTRRGAGRVITFLDEPVFRGFWIGSARLLSNAVFLGDSF